MLTVCRTSAGNGSGMTRCHRDRRRQRDLFAIFDEPAVELPQSQPPIALAAREAGDLGPGPVRRRIQIDPGDQPVPCLRVELDVMVSLPHNPDQLRGVGVKFLRRQHVQVALESADAHKLPQGQVRRLEDPAVFAKQLVLGYAANRPTVDIAFRVDDVGALVAPQIQRRGAVRTALAVVAADTVPVLSGMTGGVGRGRKGTGSSSATFSSSRNRTMLSNTSTR